MTVVTEESDIIITWDDSFDLTASAYQDLLGSSGNLLSFISYLYHHFSEQK